MSDFFQVLKDSFGITVALWVFSIVLTAIIVSYIVKRINKIDKIDSLPCEKHTESISSISIGLSKITDTLNSIEKEVSSSISRFDEKLENKIEILDTKINGMSDTFNTNLLFIDKTLESFSNISGKMGATHTGSPLKITDKGFEIIKRLGMDKMFENNWNRIEAFISNSGNETAYDLWDFILKRAVVYPDRFLHDDEIAILKQDAYENGADLSEYMRIIAVLSRDRYFKDHNIATSK